MNISDVIYVALKLTDASKKKLLDLISDSEGNRYCDHITLAYGEKVTQNHLNMVGEKATIELRKVISDDQCSCAMVSSDLSKFECQNVHPHITMICKEGTKPAYSNTLAEMFFQEHYSVECKEINLSVDCCVVAYMRDGSIVGMSEA